MAIGGKTKGKARIVVVGVYRGPVVTNHPFLFTQLLTRGTKSFHIGEDKKLLGKNRLNANVKLLGVKGKAFKIKIGGL